MKLRHAMPPEPHDRRKLNTQPVYGRENKELADMEGLEYEPEYIPINASHMTPFDPDELVSDFDIKLYNRLIQEELRAAGLEEVYEVEVSRRAEDISLPNDVELRAAIERAFERFIRRDLKPRK